MGPPRSTASRAWGIGSPERPGGGGSDINRTVRLSLLLRPLDDWGRVTSIGVYPDWSGPAAELSGRGFNRAESQTATIHFLLRPPSGPRFSSASLPHVVSAALGRMTCDTVLTYRAASPLPSDRRRKRAGAASPAPESTPTRRDPRYLFVGRKLLSCASEGRGSVRGNSAHVFSRRLLAG
jgi:hypothetical protein